MGKSKYYDNPTMTGIADYLLDEILGDATLGSDDDITNIVNSLATDKYGDDLTSSTAKSFIRDNTKRYKNYLGISNRLTNDKGVDLKGLGSLAMGAAKAHPFKTAGIGALGLGNVGGLFDNNKIGGQIGGALLGGLGAHMVSNPYTKALLALGGGELGSLFDKLRAQREQEETIRQQFQRAQVPPQY